MRIALLSSARWGSFRLSKHFIALALAAAGHDVLYVEPPVSPLSVIRHRDRWGDLVRPSDAPAEGGVRVWTPRALPGQNSAVAQRVNGARIARGVRDRLGAPDLVLAFSLESRGVVPALGAPALYHCTDSVEDLPGIAREQVVRWEAELCAAAGAVAACSLPLVAQLERRGVTARYVPHGCDRDSLAAVPDLCAALGDRPRPWVGFVGSVNFRVDGGLLRSTLDAHRGTTVVLGGEFGPPADPRARAALAEPRLVRLGRVPPGELAGLMAGLDLAVVPYADIPFNRKSFPIKIPQHLAGGVPVVTTANGAGDEYGDLVRTTTAAGWADAVADALGERGDDLRRRRRAVVERRPWTRVVDELLAAAPA